jgi:hypothetical protein
MRLRFLVGLLAVGLVASGCAGPKEPLEIGVKEFPSDVILGAHDKPAPPAAMLPPDMLQLPPAFLTPSIVSPGVLPTVPLAPPPRPPCPEADPLIPPKRETFDKVSVPPVAATLAYRNKGASERSGADAGKAEYEVNSTRTVENVKKAADGTSTFDVVSVLQDTTTRTSYRIVPVGGPATETPGLYVAAITSKRGTEAERAFNPTPDLRLLQFPAELGTRWQTAGSDPVAGKTAAWSVVILARGQVDACGTPLRTLTVVVDGTLRDCAPRPAQAPPGDPVCPPTAPGAPEAGVNDAGDPSTQIVKATYEIGTQYGGLVLADTVDVSGSAPDYGYHLSNQAIINAEPAPVGSQ